MGKSTKGRKTRLDRLWTNVIKARAGYVSEISGRSDGPITAHHIFGKPNLALRYDVKNGICLLNGPEHIYGVHDKNDALKRWKYEEEIRRIREEDWEYLSSLRNVTSAQFDWDAKEEELRELLEIYEMENA